MGGKFCNLNFQTIFFSTLLYVCASAALEEQSKATELVTTADFRVSQVSILLDQLLNVLKRNFYCVLVFI